MRGIYDTFWITYNEKKNKIYYQSTVYSRLPKTSYDTGVSKMTITYYDEEMVPHNKFDPRYRDYNRCPLCKVICRANWKLTKHMERKHGIAVKRYWQKG